ncbi:MAG: amidohydrolase [Gemmatimonadales bacterium]|nr:amidohydrolase [Gemmatimonadales bacterium]
MNRRLLPLALAALAACGRGAPADLVVFGRTWTGDPANPSAQAVAVRGDTIAAVGDSATIAALVGPQTTVLATPGLVTPGFTDGHVHFLPGGFQLASIDLRDATTKAEFIRRIAAYAAERKPGEWIVGGDWDHEQWPGTPLPERSWIDSVTRDNPVWLSRLDGHMALANSKALAAAGITRATPDIPGGEIVRGAGGEPTGILKDAAQAPVDAARPAPTPEQADAALQRAFSFAASKGVTGVVSVSVPWEEVAAWRRAHAAGTQLVRGALFPPLEQWRRVADTLRTYGPGDARLRVAGVKGYVDGSLGSTTALFVEPYLDAPGKAGLFVTHPDSLRRWVGAADSAGLQVTVHAIGERANRFILDVYDSVAKAHGAKDRRFRVEHAQHLLGPDIARFAAQGVIPSMQPSHVTDDGAWAHKRIRPAQLERTYAFRALLDAEAPLVFGSDWTVAPLDPLLGISAAVTRRTRDGKHPDGWVPSQKVTVAEALRAYTAANAYGVFAERERGVLKPGMQADLVLLDRDILRIPPTEIAQAGVLATVMGGKVTYRR